MNDNKMTPGNCARPGFGDSILLRMLGMFMVLPVLTTYGMALQGASEALIGGDRYLRPGAGGVPDPLRTVI